MNQEKTQKCKKSLCHYGTHLERTLAYDTAGKGDWTPSFKVTMVSRSKTPNEICKMITFENNNFQRMNVVDDWAMNHICTNFKEQFNLYLK